MARFATRSNIVTKRRLRLRSIRHRRRNRRQSSVKPYASFSACFSFCVPASLLAFLTFLPRGALRTALSSVSSSATSMPHRCPPAGGSAVDPSYDPPGAHTDRLLAHRFVHCRLRLQEQTGHFNNEAPSPTLSRIHLPLAVFCGSRSGKYNGKHVIKIGFRSFTVGSFGLSIARVFGLTHPILPLATSPCQAWTEISSFHFFRKNCSRRKYSNDRYRCGV